LTHPVKKRIGQVKYSQKRVWIILKRCANMRRRHEIAWFGVSLHALQCWKKRPIGAKNGKGELNAIKCANNASGKTSLGKLRKAHGVKLVRLIKP
jgi:hypothetical protein